MDGSVRFPTESIDSWQILSTSSSAYPVGVIPGSSSCDCWVVAPGTRMGIYQKLSTVGGGEVISSDPYRSGPRPAIGREPAGIGRRPGRGSVASPRR